MAVADRIRTSLSPRPAGPTASTPSANPRFPALDGFRGLAALGVLLFHVSGNTDVSSRDGIVPDLLARLGNYGVTVFFVLSGFLLYRQFVLAELRGAPFPRVGRFYWHRFLRIYPAFWLAVTVTIILSKNGYLAPGRGNISGFGQYLEIYSLTQNYRKEVFISGLFVAWTLCIEVAFYVVLPPLAWIFRKVGDIGRDDGANNLQRRLKVQLVGLVLMIIIANVFRYWVLNFDDKTSGFPVKWLDGGPIRWLPSYLDWYALGMLAALISAWAQIGRRVLPSIKAIANAPWLCVGIGAAFYGFLTMLNLPHGDFKAAPIGDDMAHYVFAGLSAFFLLLPGFLGPQDKGLVRTVMGGRIMAFIGLISYGIYLWHPIAIDRLSKLKDDNKFTGGFNAGFWPVLVAVLVFSIVTATLSYYALERPIMRFKDPKPGFWQWFNTKPGERASVAAAGGEVPVPTLTPSAAPTPHPTPNPVGSVPDPEPSAQAPPEPKAGRGDGRSLLERLRDPRGVGLQDDQAGTTDASPSGTDSDDATPVR
jgi:peptidoglycan/LPS O-acetylase OafA/YrhL